MTTSIKSSPTFGEILVNTAPSIKVLPNDVQASNSQGTNAASLTRKDYVDGTISKAANGYAKLPGGLIVQWGTAATLSTGQNTITFPTAFTATPTVVATVGQTPQTQFVFAQVSDIGITNFGLGSILHDGTRVSIAGVLWIAIGY